MRPAVYGNAFDASKSTAHCQFAVRTTVAEESRYACPAADRIVQSAAFLFRSRARESQPCHQPARQLPIRFHDGHERRRLDDNAVCRNRSAHFGKFSGVGLPPGFTQGRLGSEYRRLGAVRRRHLPIVGLPGLLRPRNVSGANPNPASERPRLLLLQRGRRTSLCKADFTTCPSLGRIIFRRVR